MVMGLRLASIGDANIKGRYARPLDRPTSGVTPHFRPGRVRPTDPPPEAAGQKSDPGESDRPTRRRRGGGQKSDSERTKGSENEAPCRRRRRRSKNPTRAGPTDRPVTRGSEADIRPGAGPTDRPTSDMLVARITTFDIRIAMTCQHTTRDRMRSFSNLAGGPFLTLHYTETKPTNLRNRQQEKATIKIASVSTSCIPLIL